MTLDNQAPLPCANGCGFFGNSDTRDLCSVCYSDYLMKIAFETKVEIKPFSNIEESKNPSVGNLDDPTNGVNKGKNRIRCDTCKKRVGFIGFKCRCGGVFCGSHRLPEEHSCGFDHKGLERERLAKTLHAGACKAPKLESSI